MSTGPTINKGKSKQDYQTPADFMAAVKLRYGDIAFDLAAHSENTQALAWFGPGSAYCEDAFATDWNDTIGQRLAWLNPPFANIGPWAERCAIAGEEGTKILFFVPASVGANWYRDFVHNRCYVLGINGRVTFAGCSDPYPRDMLLCEYGFGRTGFGIWNWRK